MHKLQHFYAFILFAVFVNYHGYAQQVRCGVVKLQSATTAEANMSFTDFTKYKAGITLMSVARLRVNVEHKTDVDLACRWKLRMFIENNSGAGTAIGKWEEITLYGNGNAEIPSIRDLEVRVNNNCGTPLDTGFRSFTDVNDVLDIIAETIQEDIVNAGECTANGTKNVNGPGSYLTNYDEYSFDVDLRLKPGYRYNPGIYKLNIRFRLEEVN